MQYAYMRRKLALDKRSRSQRLLDRSWQSNAATDTLSMEGSSMDGKENISQSMGQTEQLLSSPRNASVTVKPQA